MKKITLLFLFLLTIGFGFAQTTTYNITFEPGTDGSDPNEWSTFENADGDNADAIVANPDTSGINTSATALQMDTNIHVNNGGGSQIYAGLQSQQPGIFGTWELESGQTMNLTMMVYKEEISETRVQFVNATNGTVFQIAMSNTVVNQWELLTYDLTPHIASAENVNINRIVVFPDWQERNQINTNLIDNINFVANAIAAPTEPTDAPEAPTEDAMDVISIYSDAYTDVTVNGFNQFGGSTLTDEVIASNNVKKYVNLDFTGIEFTGANLIDASSMNTFHIDVWSPDSNDFKVKLVDFGANQIYQGGDDTEFEITFASPTAGQWNAYDIPLADFTGINTDNLAQLILVKGGGTAFVDNIYFYSAPATDPTVAAPVPTPMQSEVINMYSNTYTSDVAVSSWRAAWSTSTYTDNVQVDGSAGSEAKRYIDADFVGVEFYGDPVDATSMNYFHVDVWSPNATVFRVKLVDLGTGSPIEGELPYNIAQGEWVSLDIPLADFADGTKVTNPANLLTVRNSIQQLIFSGQPTGTFDFYVDNIYFSTVASLSVEENNIISDFNVYPNPSSYKWNIKSLSEEITSIQVYDILGKEVMTMKPNALETEIDNSNLNIGLYYAKLNTAIGSKTVKLIKK